MRPGRLISAQRSRPVEQGRRLGPAAASARPLPGPFQLLGNPLVRAGRRPGPGATPAGPGRPGGRPGGRAPADAGRTKPRSRPRSGSADGRKRTRSRIVISCRSSAAAAASAVNPRRSPACHSRLGSPVGSAAAASSRDWVPAAAPAPPGGNAAQAGGRGGPAPAGARSRGKFAGGEFLADLDERQRVAASLGDDAFGYRAGKPGPGGGCEQLTGVRRRQSGDAEFG